MKKQYIYVNDIKNKDTRKGVEYILLTAGLPWLNNFRVDEKWDKNGELTNFKVTERQKTLGYEYLTLHLLMKNVTRIIDATGEIHDMYDPFNGKPYEDYKY